MGCDIHSYAEVKTDGKWSQVTEYFNDIYSDNDKSDYPFDYRSYTLFAFLAGVRNYDRCEPISERKGLPDDVSDDVGGEYLEYSDEWHSVSYLTLAELLAFDYDKTFWNRRVSKQTSPNCWTGAALAEEGEGTIISYRDNLGDCYFNILKELKELGEPENVRVVFWFDN